MEQKHQGGWGLISFCFLSKAAEKCCWVCPWSAVLGGKCLVDLAEVLPTAFWGRSVQGCGSSAREVVPEERHIWWGDLFLLFLFGGVGRGGGKRWRKRRKERQNRGGVSSTLKLPGQWLSVLAAGTTSSGVSATLMHRTHPPRCWGSSWPGVQPGPHWEFLNLPRDSYVRRGLGLSPTQTSAWGVSGGERREEGRKRHREGQRGTVRFLRFNGSFWGAKEIGFLCAPWRWHGFLSHLPFYQIKLKPN